MAGIIVCPMPAETPVDPVQVAETGRQVEERQAITVRG